jgi:hypothetical protein
VWQGADAVPPVAYNPIAPVTHPALPLAAPPNGVQGPAPLVVVPGVPVAAPNGPEGPAPLAAVAGAPVDGGGAIPLAGQELNPEVPGALGEDLTEGALLAVPPGGPADDGEWLLGANEENDPEAVVVAPPPAGPEEDLFTGGSPLGAPDVLVEQPFFAALKEALEQTVSP